jgi:hypothetical protein
LSFFKCFQKTPVVGWHFIQLNKYTFIWACVFMGWELISCVFNVNHVPVYGCPSPEWSR